MPYMWTLMFFIWTQCLSCSRSTVLIVKHVICSHSSINNAFHLCLKINTSNKCCPYSRWNGPNETLLKSIILVFKKTVSDGLIDKKYLLPTVTIHVCCTWCCTWLTGTLVQASPEWSETMFISWDGGHCFQLLLLVFFCGFTESLGTAVVKGAGWLWNRIKLEDWLTTLCIGGWQDGWDRFFELKSGWFSCWQGRCLGDFVFFWNY